MSRKQLSTNLHIETIEYTQPSKQGKDVPHAVPGDQIWIFEEHNGHVVVIRGDDEEQSLRLPSPQFGRPLLLHTFWKFAELTYRMSLFKELELAIDIELRVRVELVRPLSYLRATRKKDAPFLETSDLLRIPLNKALRNMLALEPQQPGEPISPLAVSDLKPKVPFGPQPGTEITTFIIGLPDFAEIGVLIRARVENISLSAEYQAAFTQATNVLQKMLQDYTIKWLSSVVPFNSDEIPFRTNIYKALAPHLHSESFQYIYDTIENIIRKTAVGNSKKRSSLMLLTQTLFKDVLQNQIILSLSQARASLQEVYQDRLIAQSRQLRPIQPNTNTSNMLPSLTQPPADSRTLTVPQSPVLPVTPSIAPSSSTGQAAPTMSPSTDTIAEQTSQMLRTHTAIPSPNTQGPLPTPALLIPSSSSEDVPEQQELRPEKLLTSTQPTLSSTTLSQLRTPTEDLIPRKLPTPQPGNTPVEGERSVPPSQAQKDATKHTSSPQSETPTPPEATVVSSQDQDLSPKSLSTPSDGGSTANIASSPVDVKPDQDLSPKSLSAPSDGGSTADSQPEANDSITAPIDPDQSAAITAPDQQEPAKQLFANRALIPALPLDAQLFQNVPPVEQTFASGSAASTQSSLSNQQPSMNTHAFDQFGTQPLQQPALTQKQLKLATYVTQPLNQLSLDTLANPSQIPSGPFPAPHFISPALIEPQSFLDKELYREQSRASREEQIEQLYRYGQKQNWKVTPPQDAICEDLYVDIGGDYKVWVGGVSDNYPNVLPVIQVVHRIEKVPQLAVNRIIIPYLNRSFNLSELVQAIADSVREGRLQQNPGGQSGSYAAP